MKYHVHACLIIIALTSFLGDVPHSTFGRFGFVHGKMYGPHLCADRIRLHIGDKLTEYPEYPREYSDHEGQWLNFLSYGDVCNHSAQVTFEETLLATYQRFVEDDDDETAYSNEDLFEALDQLWNDWRAHIHVSRICNPRRLLACHPIDSTCRCRQEFPEGDEWLPRGQAQSTHSRSTAITLHEETAETYDAGNDLYEKVIMCRAEEMSSCGWEAPWLGFCHIPCEKGSYCISTRDLTASKRCIKCGDPSAPEGLEKCVETAFGIS